MQLNPARGRKHKGITCVCNSYEVVYAAQPREGTETCELITQILRIVLGLCSSTPRGDGNRRYASLTQGTTTYTWFMQLNPARGRKLKRDAFSVHAFFVGLCSSTPRGDGNSLGTSAYRQSCEAWFMQLNPARGRKQGLIALYLYDTHLGLCSSTPRGDGNLLNINRPPGERY